MQPAQLLSAAPAHRRRGWAWAGLVFALVLGAGALVAALTHDQAPDAVPLPRPVVPTVSTLPVGPFGQSAVSAAGSIGSPLPPTPAAVTDPSALATVRTARLQLRVLEGELAGALDRASAVAASYGGYVAHSSLTNDRGVSTAQIGLRVPADRFDGARQEVERLGTVESQVVSETDVHGQLEGADARLRSLGLQENALNALIAKANTVSDVVQVQSSLSGVRQQIDQLQGHRARLQEAATFSTIDLVLDEDDGPDPGDERHRALGRRIGQAMDGSIALVGGMIVVVGWVLPVLVLAGAGYAVVRGFRRVRSISRPG